MGTGDTRLDLEIIKIVASAGVGGVLAVFMFMFYRKDVKQFTELWRTVSEQQMIVIRENTASNVKLIALIESLERNSIRKGDIELMIERRFQQERE